MSKTKEKGVIHYIVDVDTVFSVCIFVIFLYLVIMRLAVEGYSSNVLGEILVLILIYRYESISQELKRREAEK